MDLNHPRCVRPGRIKGVWEYGQDIAGHDDTHSRDQPYSSTYVSHSPPGSVEVTVSFVLMSLIGFKTERSQDRALLRSTFMLINMFACSQLCQSECVCLVFVRASVSVKPGGWLGSLQHEESSNLWRG